jgi:hypothetical protein
MSLVAAEAADPVSEAGSAPARVARRCRKVDELLELNEVRMDAIDDGQADRAR